MSSSSASPKTGHEDAPVLASRRSWSAVRRDREALAQRLALAAPVDHVEAPARRPSTARRRRARPRAAMITLIQPATESSAPSAAGHGHAAAREPGRERDPERARAVRLAEAQHDHRHVGDRERDHRAEGEDPGEEARCRAASASAKASTAAIAIATYGVPSCGCSRPTALGIWRLVAERVGQPRHAEHLAVHRGEQDRRRQSPRPCSGTTCRSHSGSSVDTIPSTGASM